MRVPPTDVAFKRPSRIEEAAKVLSEELRSMMEGTDLDLRDLEQKAQRLSRQVMGPAIEGALAAAPDTTAEVSCPRCGRMMRRVDGKRPRVVYGIVGSWVIKRVYLHCARCRIAASPRDAQLGLGVGRLSPALERAICRLGIETAFAQAAAVLE